MLPLLPQLVLVPMHLGALHPVEKALVLAVAFGPFLVLGVVVHVVRRRDIAEEQKQHEAAEGRGPLTGPVAEDG